MMAAISASPAGEGLYANNAPIPCAPPFDQTAHEPHPFRPGSLHQQIDLGRASGSSRMKRGLHCRESHVTVLHCGHGVSPFGFSSRLDMLSGAAMRLPHSMLDRNVRAA